MSVFTPSSGEVFGTEWTHGLKLTPTAAWGLEHHLCCLTPYLSFIRCYSCLGLRGSTSLLVLRCFSPQTALLQTSCHHMGISSLYHTMSKWKGMRGAIFLDHPFRRLISQAMLCCSCNTLYVMEGKHSTNTDALGFSFKLNRTFLLNFCHPELSIYCPCLGH